jgi:hypothetical protein
MNTAPFAGIDGLVLVPAAGSVSKKEAEVAHCPCLRCRVSHGRKTNRRDLYRQSIRLRDTQSSALPTRQGGPN